MFQPAMLVYRSVVVFFQKFTWIIWNDESLPSIIILSWVSKMGFIWMVMKGGFKLSPPTRVIEDIQTHRFQGKTTTNRYPGPMIMFSCFLFPVVLITCHPTIFTRKTRDVEHPASGLQALMVMGGMISSTTVARASWHGRKVGSCNGERLPLWRLFSNKNSDLML